MNRMAPEVISDSPYSESCDVYSFGIIMWELFFEKTPFSEYNVLILPGKILNGLRPTIPNLLQTSFEEYFNLMQDCWAQDPTKRPKFKTVLKRLKMIQNNKELIASLNEYQKTMSMKIEMELKSVK